MQLSAVIPVYNGGSYVSTTIESVLRQEGVDLEVIVVDDGSTDDTPSILRGFEGRIRSVRQENRGLSAARNTGIGMALGRYVAFVDADDTWEPDKSRKQVAVLEARPACGLIWCDAYRIDANGRRLGLCLGDAAHRVPTGRCLDQLLLRGNFIVMPGVMVRRSIFDQVGTFNESLPSVEDYDMWLRIAGVAEIGIVPEPLASYREWAGQMSHKRQRMLDCELEVLAAALARHPDLAETLRRGMRRRYAALHDTVGYRNLQDGALGQALAKFLLAIRHDPPWAKPYLHLVAVALASVRLWRPPRSNVSMPPGP